MVYKRKPVFLFKVFVTLAATLSGSVLHAATFEIRTAGELARAIGNVEDGDTLQLMNNITLNQELPPVTAQVAITTNTPTGRATINGAGTYRGMLVDTNGKNFSITNVTFDNCAAQGGDGGSGVVGAGGGAGLGAGLLVKSGSNVAITDVFFTNNQVSGGDGGQYQDVAGIGGGGGLGGDGGQALSTTAVGGGGGGGVGINASGGDVTTTAAYQADPTLISGGRGNLEGGRAGRRGLGLQSDSRTGQCRQRGR